MRRTRRRAALTPFAATRHNHTMMKESHHNSSSISSMLAFLLFFLASGAIDWNGSADGGPRLLFAQAQVRPFAFPYAKKNVEQQTPNNNEQVQKFPRHHHRYHRHQYFHSSMMSSMSKSSSGSKKSMKSSSEMKSKSKSSSSSWYVYHPAPQTNKYPPAPVAVVMAPPVNSKGRLPVMTVGGDAPAIIKGSKMKMPNDAIKGGATVDQSNSSKKKHHHTSSSSIMAKGKSMGKGKGKGTGKGKGKGKGKGIDGKGKGKGLWIREPPPPEWRQVGQDLNGEAAGDQFSVALDLSANGSRLAVGAWLYDGADGSRPDTGQVRIFEYDSNGSIQWMQLGQTIEGEMAGDVSGIAVALSGSGSIAAIGAVTNDGEVGGQDDAGHVRVFQFQQSFEASMLTNDTITRTEKWVQLGSDLDGVMPGERFGTSVDLSDDGHIVAAGGYWNDENGIDAGQVRIFRYDTVARDWSQMGQDINGQAADDNFGISVSLSANGLIVAAGAFFHDVGNVTNAGQVRVFAYDMDNSNTNQWTQLGQTIVGDGAEDRLGFRVALSADGLVFATGAYLNNGNGIESGIVRVYGYRSELAEWVQLGQDIYGDAPGDRLGWSVALSADGAILSAGAYFSNRNGVEQSGYVRIYQYNDNTDQWEQLGEDLEGQDGERFGSSVSLSSDGSVLATGGVLNADNGEASGEARVFVYQ